MTHVELQELIKKTIAEVIASGADAERLAQVEAGIKAVADQHAELMEKHTASEASLNELRTSIAEDRMVRPGVLEDVQLKSWPPDRNWLRAEPRDEREQEVQKMSDDLYLITKLTDMDPKKDRRHVTDAAVRKYLDHTRVGNRELIEKALDTYTATGGLEWVPTVMSADFIRIVRELTKVRPLFDQFTMTAKTIEKPGGSGTPTVYRRTGSENATITEDAALLSRNVTWTSEDLASRRDYSDQLDEDSIVSLAPHIRTELAAALSRNMDLGILAGDSTVPHQDGHAQTDPRTCWLGLRGKCLDDTGGNVDLNTFTLDNMLKLPAGMAAAHSEEINDLVWIVPHNVFWGRLFTLVDANNNPVWLPANTPGSPNPVVTGQVGTLVGVPVILSSLIREDLNGSGVYEEGYEDPRTVLYLVDRKAWLLGERREITIEADKNIIAGSFRVVMSWRGDFQHLYTTTLTTVMGYNIDLV